MLLPSAFDCAMDIQSPRTSFLPAARMLSPPPSSRSPPSQVSTNIYSTCRALQSLLGASIPSSRSPSKQPPPTLASPIDMRTTSRPPKSHKSKPATITKVAQIPSRKRRRSSTPSKDQENMSSKPVTPKRQRLYPPTLPLGLEQSDFDALHPVPSTPPSHFTTTPGQFNLQPDLNFTTPSRPLPFDLPPKPKSEGEDIEMRTSTPPDPTMSPESTALISVILPKLRISQCDWDRLGKEGKGSIGERFKALVGEGEGGMRRGSGGLRRSGLDRMEFGEAIGG